MKAEIKISQVTLSNQTNKNDLNFTNVANKLFNKSSQTNSQKVTRKEAILWQIYKYPHLLEGKIQGVMTNQVKYEY